MVAIMVIITLLRLKATLSADHRTQVNMWCDPHITTLKLY